MFHNDEVNAFMNSYNCGGGHQTLQVLHFSCFWKMSLQVVKKIAMPHRNDQNALEMFQLKFSEA
jgi:hypothetical protein